jgi:hypothetical protein
MTKFVRNELLGLNLEKLGEAMAFAGIVFD